MITLITADLSSFLPVDPVVVVCPLPCLLPTPAREASTGLQPLNAALMSEAPFACLPP